MHKKMAKAITGSLMAASMLASTAAAFAPMSADAGLCVGQVDFDEGVGLPWHTCVTNPAKQTMKISGGKYSVTLDNIGGKKNGGDSRWDCQFRHRSLHIESGHTYKVHFEIESDAEGELATHIANLAGEEPVWISNHGGTQAWGFKNQNCGTEDHGGSSGNLVIHKGKNVFESTFTADHTLEVAEWAFHYGGAGEYQDTDCFPKGTTLTFDNMSLECTSCGEKFVDKETTPCLWDPTNELGVVHPRSNVRVNQVGYLPNMVKKATYATEKSTSAVKWEVKNSSGTTVASGTAKDGGFDEDAGEYTQVIDFSEVTEPGTYHIEVSNTSDTWTNPKTGEVFKMYISHDFQIGNDVYDGALRDALNYYYQNRSGMAIDEQYITSYNENDPGGKSKLAHEGGHAPSDDAYVQSAWVSSYGQVFDGDKDYQIDGVGGWYDAGDHGKYVVNGGISVWTLQNMYERSVVKKTDSKWADGKTMAIPQKYNVGKVSWDGTGAPDILDEARVELEWMFNMIVDSSDPYWGSGSSAKKNGVGLVYHKLHDHKWTGLATKPYDYQDEWKTTRIVKPPTYAATFNMIACAAQASRLWRGIDDDFADECLKNAKASWDAVMKYQSDWAIDKGNWKDDPFFAPLDQAIGGGGYGDTYVQDDAYWAACELFSTTGDDTYYNFLKDYKNKNDSTGTDKAFSLTTSLGGGENNGSFSSFNWGCTAGLGTLTLALSDKTPAADKKTVDAAIVAAADKYLAQMAKSGMGVPYVGTTFQDAINIGEGIDVTGYEWGSNSFVINNAIVMAYAYDVARANKYISGVTEALDYIFGRNGNGFSYVTGYGTYHENNPHHRYWSYELDHDFPMAPSGVMSGGPGAGLQDPYVAGLGYERGKVASQKCFVDSIEAWSVNEVTINWNAPFAWAISFLDDEAEKAPKFDETEPVTDPTDGPITDADWGDANVDGKVDLQDAVAILQYSALPTKYPLEAQGLLNADVVDNGTSGVNGIDALSIQMYDAKLIKQTEWPITKAAQDAKLQ
ncbi:MAG TPA: glycoside hydrolase family 9 protein [Ruminococcus sp.]|nr:glycoside hydrolase family 9 protein [Ruminococcus sp.]